MIPFLIAVVLLQVDVDPSTYELWIAALAILTTLGSSLILAIPSHWGPWAKRGVVAAIALALSLGGTFYEGRLDNEDWGRTWLIVFLGATAIYTLIVKPVTAAFKGNTIA